MNNTVAKNALQYVIPSIPSKYFLYFDRQDIFWQFKIWGNLIVHNLRSIIVRRSDSNDNTQTQLSEQGSTFVVYYIVWRDTQQENKQSRKLIAKPIRFDAIWWLIHIY